jgi:hypothetical protein
VRRAGCLAAWLGTFKRSDPLNIVRAGIRPS